MNVGHLGAAHALVNPAHHVAQNALGVVVEFLLLLERRPVGHGGVHFVAGAVQKAGVDEGTMLNWMLKEGAVK